MNDRITALESRIDNQAIDITNTRDALKNKYDKAGGPIDGTSKVKITGKTSLDQSAMEVRYIDGISSAQKDANGILYLNNNSGGYIYFGKKNAHVDDLGKVYGAVWNDFAEYRQSDETCAGRVVCECGNGFMTRSIKRLQPGAEIVSDTFGFAIGETADCKTPIAVAGRVLAYPNEKQNKYKPGDPVCAGPNGTVSKMSRREVRKYPDRIIGTVSEIPDYDIWGENEIKVNGRIWIRIK